jgi:hypothetical protein
MPDSTRRDTDHRWLPQAQRRNDGEVITSAESHWPFITGLRSPAMP